MYGMYGMLWQVAVTEVGSQARTGPPETTRQTEEKKTKKENKEAVMKGRKYKEGDGRSSFAVLYGNQKKVHGGRGGKRF